MSTARTVLHLLSLLARSEHGMRADDVAKALGKSTSTAYNLLDTLCQERFVVHAGNGFYRLAAEAESLVPPEPSRNHLPSGLAGVLDELFARTHKRVYLAAAHSGQVVIPLVRGRQGMPLIPGLGVRIGENAHALGLGKIALSLLSERALERYIGHGLRAFTPATIISPGRLRAQLAEIGNGAVASDCEEFAIDFCCLAMPVRDGEGRAVAALGVSMSARSFELEHEQLSEVLREVAEQASTALGSPAVPAISEDRAVLERPVRSTLRSAARAAHMSST
ncbi:MAG TPA: IclR family transcriptional regulator C-terminal domain-containing protein [Solirubrobacteraceae bacterium]|nr:IclR family transcriptional regulator C-terminal domain-containing protein [Solirubrobacteraceae bacterium]